MNVRRLNIGEPLGANLRRWPIVVFFLLGLAQPTPTLADESAPQLLTILQKKFPGAVSDAQLPTLRRKSGPCSKAASGAE